MKLRIRPFQSKETLKIQVPNSCTLPQLRQVLSETLPDSPFPDLIHLSLNRKDDLQSDGTDTLQSLGIAAGDLIYFSLQNPNPQNTIPQATDSTPTPLSNDTECSTTLNPQETLPGILNSDSLMLNSQKAKTLDSSSQMAVEPVSNMEVDDEDDENNRNTDELFEVVDSFSVPGFLRKVFAAELGDDAGRDHKLIVIAVHAVLLESGFAAFDNDAGVVVDGFQWRSSWSSARLMVSLFYTMRSEATKSVVLEFRSLGKYMNVYGKLVNGSGKGGTHHWVQLNEDELVPYLNIVWANCGVMENVGGQGGESRSTWAEKEVFKFWRIVKDNLALPLLIDLCEEAGLELPPCFMRLPTELKLKILESLPGVDVAKVSCVCSELRYLASSDDLWKLKFDEEFRNESKEGHVSWKKAFSMAWSVGRRVGSRVRRSPYWPMPYWPQPRRRRAPNNPLIFPRFIGDDPSPQGNYLHTRLHENTIHPMRSFSPPCNLGSRHRFI